jgi:hypothetical protein
MGSGPIVDLYDAEGVALIAYIEGMEMYNSILQEWSDSDELDPDLITQKVEKHIEELKKRFNITENGRELPTNSSM